MNCVGCCAEMSCCGRVCGNGHNKAVLNIHPLPPTNTVDNCGSVWLMQLTEPFTKFLPTPFEVAHRSEEEADCKFDNMLLGGRAAHHCPSTLEGQGNAHNANNLHHDIDLQYNTQRSQEKTRWGLRSGEGDRMVYVSWLPRCARASEPASRAAAELQLKSVLRHKLGIGGLNKVFLYPPSSAHCKLLFANRMWAQGFLRKYGGAPDSVATLEWKIDVCTAYDIHTGLPPPCSGPRMTVHQLLARSRKGILGTPVKVVWADESTSR